MCGLRGAVVFFSVVPSLLESDKSVVFFQMAFHPRQIASHMAATAPTIPEDLRYLMVATRNEFCHACLEDQRLGRACLPSAFEDGFRAQYAIILERLARHFQVASIPIPGFGKSLRGGGACDVPRSASCVVGADI